MTCSDFDGTITTHDTLPLLLKFYAGKWGFAWGVLCCLPWIVLYKLHVIDGGRAKERLFSHFFKGMAYSEFNNVCKKFAIFHYAKHTFALMQNKLSQALSSGERVLVVTASMGEWVTPWLKCCALDGVTVIATKPELNEHNKLTGHFSTPNCNGTEKWRRIVEAVPEAAGGIDVAYGDSRGDRAMLSHAGSAYYRNFITPEKQLKWYRRHGNLLFWSVTVLLVLYQLLGVFFGMDVADSGFYLTFYDNIFTHPNSVEYNFMYYLSGVIGGTIQSLLPGIGIAGMRIAGVVFNTLCGVALYLALRDRMPEWVIALGCAIVITTFIAPPYTLSYDLCTILFYVLTAIALWKALEADSIGYMLLAGVLAGMNVFTRLPNVLGLLLVFVPLIKAIIDQRTSGYDVNWKLAILTCLIIFLTAIVTTLLIILFMPGEHFSAFLNVLNDLTAIATDTTGTASHTGSQMIMTQLRFYATELWTAVKLAVPVLAYAWAHMRLSKRPIAQNAVKVGTIALFVWFTARMHPLQPVWVMCVAGCVAIIIRDMAGALTIPAIVGIMVMLIMPLGSDGAYNNGTIIAWIAAPIAAQWWSNSKRLAFPLALIAVCAVRMVAGGAYFDGGTLLEKKSTVNAERAACVYTTAERAQVLNTMLKGIAPHILPGTTLMAYGSIPTINYLTYTHPYMGCSWPEQLSASMLSQKLEIAKELEGLPYILRQKFNTLGSQWGKPAETYLTDYGTQNTYQDNRKLQVLNEFLKKNEYKIVYEDSHFVLYKSSPSLTENNVK